MGALGAAIGSSALPLSGKSCFCSSFLVPLCLSCFQQQRLVNVASDEFQSAHSFFLQFSTIFSWTSIFREF